MACIINPDICGCLQAEMDLPPTSPPPKPPKQRNASKGCKCPKPKKKKKKVRPCKCHKPNLKTANVCKELTCPNKGEPPSDFDNAQNCEEQEEELEEEEYEPPPRCLCICIGAQKNDKCTCIDPCTQFPKIPLIVKRRNTFTVPIWDYDGCYAKTLLDAAIETCSVPKMEESLKILKKHFDDPEFHDYVINPTIDKPIRMQKFKQFGRKNKIHCSLIKVLGMLLEKNQLGFVPLIIEKFAHIKQNTLNQVIAKVSSSKALDPCEKLKLECTLKKSLENKEQLVTNYRIDRRIAPGIVDIVLVKAKKWRITENQVPPYDIPEIPSETCSEKLRERSSLFCAEEPKKKPPKSEREERCKYYLQYLKKPVIEEEAEEEEMDENAEENK